MASRYRVVRPNDSPRPVDLGNALLIIAIGSLILLVGVFTALR